MSTLVIKKYRKNLNYRTISRENSFSLLFVYIVLKNSTKKKKFTRGDSILWFLFFPFFFFLLKSSRTLLKYIFFNVILFILDKSFCEQTEHYVSFPFPRSLTLSHWIYCASYNCPRFELLSRLSRDARERDVNCVFTCAQLHISPRYFNYRQCIIIKCLKILLTSVVDGYLTKKNFFFPFFHSI